MGSDPSQRSNLPARIATRLNINFVIGCYYKEVYYFVGVLSYYVEVSQKSLIYVINGQEPTVVSLI